MFAVPENAMPREVEDLRELVLESTIGGLGVDADDRRIPVVSLRDFAERREEITDELWNAAADVGFFQLADHGIDGDVVDAVFGAARDFFALPVASKATVPWKRELNSGWESKAQVRPSTRVADQKESFQMTRPNMDGLWPSEADVPGFSSALQAFEDAAWKVAMDVLSCFADRLGFEQDFFNRAHDPAGDGYQSTVRLLHYFPMSGTDFEAGQWRAGAHTDYDCLTLLFQREGQSGLQICPGQDVEAQRWTSVPTSEKLITCNIGDMLMRWSDDQLKSNLHRVRGPHRGESAESRYSVAFFAQANKPTLIESPTGAFEALTAEEFLQRRINANFTA